jgi:hypothetical protein
MQRIDRATWLGVVTSIVIALALVSLIPIYDLAGGHAEHGLQTTGTGGTPHIDYVARDDGVVVRVMPVAGVSREQVRQVGKNLWYRYQFGDFGSDAPGPRATLAVALAKERTHIEIAYRETAEGCDVLLTSRDVATRALLQAWMQAGEGEGDTPQVTKVLD